MSELFNVVFSGEVSGRADPAVVRANVGKLFNASEAILDKLFSGQPVAVKKMVDRAGAMKVRAMMKQAGAETRLVAVDEQGRPLAAAAPTQAPATAVPAAPVRPAAAAPGAPSAPASAPAATQPVAESMAERVNRMAEEQKRVNAGSEAAAKEAAAQAAAEGQWVVAPVGARLSPVNAGPAPVVPDISDIVLSPSGSDVIADSERPVVAPVRVDISGIDLAPPGTEVLLESEREHIVPVVVDISGISVAEVGAPLDEIREEKMLINPDISHLTMAD